MFPRILLGLLLLAPIRCFCQLGSDPIVTGVVTYLATPTEFDVNGRTILLSSNTRIDVGERNQPHDKEGFTSIPLTGFHAYLGEPAEVFGKIDGKTHAITASRIVIHTRQPHEVSGFGILDAVLPLPPAAVAGDQFVRADGYAVLIPVSVTPTFEKPLSLPSDIHVNVWMTFSGKQNADGTVVADKVHFSKNTISHGEDNLREKTEYDPTAVDPNKKQSAISKGFLGIDPKKIPPYKDAAMQARVSAIGAKLVPKYQADFPDTEETRIDFRFQVIDSTKWRDAFTLPNGIILVPRQVVERMQNDDQLATVLADNIACALEKQPLTGHQDGTAMSTANTVGSVAGFFIPGAGLATEIATGTTAVKLQHIHEDQSGRVSLTLLHDAGYDIQQAPLAWWLLAPKKPKEISATTLPRRAEYLYRFLGETWPTN